VTEHGAARWMQAWYGACGQEWQLADCLAAYSHRGAVCGDDGIVVERPLGKPAHDEAILEQPPCANDHRSVPPPSTRFTCAVSASEAFG
jgi:hypothetical protein